jgi:uncharacterized protein YehS (DUF1456 family)
MINNYVLKEIVKALDLNGIEVMKIYQLVDKKITIEDVIDVLREEHDPEFILLNDDGFLLFLDGLIIDRRGSTDKKPLRFTKVKVTNNLILKKLRVAFDLKDEDMVEIFSHENFEISKSELTPYFRKKGHKNYKQCSEAMLKSFIKGYKSFLNTKKV